MNRNKPIHILGAGLGGLAASIVLARAGAEVHLYERYDVVGKRFQGDLQGIDNWSTQQDVLSLLNSFGIDPTFPSTPFTKVSIFDGKRSFEGHSKEPLFYLVKRGPFPDTLDTALCQQALSYGVQIHYRSTYPQEKAHLIATGPIRRALVASDRGVAFKTDLPNMAVGIFHDDLAYLGYSYLLVANGYGCICTVVFKDFHRLNECFEKTIAAVKKIAPVDLGDVHPVGGVGSFVLNHPLQQGNALLVGEAAGFQDLLWGFGIRTALTSGYLAAQSLLNKENYKMKIDQMITQGMKASVVNRFLWEKLKWNKKPLIPYGFHLPGSLRTQFRLLYNFSPIHRLLYPFASRYVQRTYGQTDSNRYSEN